MVRLYYHDEIDSVDFRKPHDSGEPVEIKTLVELGAFYKFLPNEADVFKIADERDYSNHDVVNISNKDNEKMDMLETFYQEHLHEDEEIRYILDGSGYFDLRDPRTDKWIRCHVDKGDFLLVPAGIYHRFTLTEDNYIKALRLFKDEPKWKALNKSKQTDETQIYKSYLNSLTK